MNTPDLINGMLEIGGSIFMLKNVMMLYQDKVVRGVHWAPAGYFAMWGLWNLFYYPQLGQWFSVGGSVALVIVNIVWFSQMIYYGRKG